MFAMQIAKSETEQIVTIPGEAESERKISRVDISSQAYEANKHPAT